MGGAGNYAGGTGSANFLIVPKAAAFTIGVIADQTYTGAAIVPTVTVTDHAVSATPLVAGTDYTVAYSDNVNAGAATVTVGGAGNYVGGTGSANFLIVPKAAAFTVVTVAETTYTGAAITPTVVVKDGTATLVAGTDYTVAYSDNVNAGTATVTATGAGNYAGGTGSAYFEIKPAVVTFTVAAVAAVTYTGAAITPTVVVKDGAATLVAGTDYTVAYSDNVNAGTATVTVAGAGNYAGGTGGTSFEITKAAGDTLAGVPTLAGKTYAAITAAAVAAPSNGQSVEYAVADVAGASPVVGWQSSTTFTGLVAGHTYYIYARAAEDMNRYAGVAVVSAAIATDEGVTGITVTPAADTVAKGTATTFVAVVTGGVSVPTAVTWSVTGAASASTTVTGSAGSTPSGSGILTVAADETATVLTIRATSVFDTTYSAVAVVTLYTELAGSTVTTPPGSDPVRNPDGSVTLPDGGRVTTPGGDLEVTVPPGTVIDGTGKITLPADGGGTATNPDTGVEITLPPATVIDVDGNGNIVITPGTGDVTIVTPGTGETVTVPDDGSEIVIDPARPGDPVRPVFVPHSGHLAYPSPMTAVYNGGSQPLVVSPAVGVVGMGKVTVRYDGDTDAPTNAGTYAVTVDIEAGENYKAVDGLPLGDYTVAKAPVAVAWGVTALPYVGTAQCPTAIAIGVLREDIPLTIVGARTEIGSGYVASADFAASAAAAANYTPVNAVVEFSIIVNPNYTYAVSFDTRGGNVIMPLRVKYGNLAPVPSDPVRSGHVFNGWRTDTVCSGGGAGRAWDFSSDVVTGDTTLYACWTRTLSDEAALVTLSVNSDLVGDSMTYMASCQDNTATIELTVSPRARAYVNGEEYGTVVEVPLTGDVTVVVIRVVSESGAVTGNYTLTIAAALSGDKLYFRRRGDVLAINHNPETNGGRAISGIRWYRKNKLVGTGRVVSVLDEVSAYRAEVEIDGVWHKLCPYRAVGRLSGVTAFPNPVSRDDVLSLDLPVAFVGGKLDIYTLGGALVRKGIALEYELTGVGVEGLDAGIYLFRVTSADGDGDVVKVIVK